MEIKIKEKKLILNGKTYGIQTLLDLVNQIPNIKALTIDISKMSYTSKAEDNTMHNKEKYFAVFHFITAFDPLATEPWGKKYVDVRDACYTALDRCCLIENNLNDISELKDDLIVQVNNDPTILNPKQYDEHKWDNKYTYKVETIYK